MQGAPLAELPTRIYKYRDWGRPFNRTLLTQRELYFSSPADFNDPFDSRLRVRYDKLPDGELEQLLYQRFRDGNPAAGHEDGMAAASRAFQKIRDKDALEIIHRGEYEANCGFLGVFSASIERDNILMWSHYAQSHSGFVVGLDTGLLFEDVPCTIAEVSYQDEYPVLFPEPQPQLAIMDLMSVLNTKSSLWAYEREIRLCKAAGANNALPFRPEVIKEVILGCKISPQHRSEILAVAAALPTVQLYEARVNDEAFVLDIMPLYS